MELIQPLEILPFTVLDEHDNQELLDMGHKYQDETLNIRENTHGDFSITAQYAQGFKDIIKEREEKLTELQKEALDMICSKIARILCGNPNEPDHWKDISGYANLVEFNLTKDGEEDTTPVQFKYRSTTDSDQAWKYP